MARTNDVPITQLMRGRNAKSAAFVAQGLGISLGMVSKMRGNERIIIRLNGRGKILGHYTFKPVEEEIERRKLINQKRLKTLRKRKISGPR